MPKTPRTPAKPKKKAAKPAGKGAKATAVSGAPIAWPEGMLAPLAQFKPWPGNAKKHPPEQVDLLAQILLKRGPDQPIVVDEEWIILKGHGRLSGAQKAGLERFPFVQRFGLSEIEKREIRLEDNAVPLMSSWDLALLRDDIAFLDAGNSDLSQLGFAPMQLMQFREGPGLNDPTKEWRGMPEFTQTDKTAFRSIVVHFKDQGAVDEFGRALDAKITEQTRFLWYPEIEIETYADKRYAAAPKK